MVKCKEGNYFAQVLLLSLPMPVADITNQSQHLLGLDAQQARAIWKATTNQSLQVISLLWCWKEPWSANQKTRIPILDLLPTWESWSPIWASEPISVKWRLRKTVPALRNSDQLFLLLTSPSCSSIPLTPACPEVILQQIIVSVGISLSCLMPTDAQHSLFPVDLDFSTVALLTIWTG